MINATPPIHDGPKPCDREGESPPPIQPGSAEIAAGLFGKVSPLSSVLFLLMGLLGFVAIIVAVLHFGSLERLIALARSVRPAWLFAAVLAQVATYLCAALVWRQALHSAGHPLPLRTLVPLGVAKLFTDQVLPSGGISGTMLVVSGLVRRRVRPEIAMATMLTGLISFDIAYLIVVISSAEILRLHNRANLALLSGVTVFALITIAIPATVLGVKRWGDRQPLAWLSKVLGMTGLFGALAKAPTDFLHSPGLLVQTTGLQLAIFLLDAVTLWLAFNSIGEAPAFWIVFASFAVASMIATIGPIPVGLGTFEAGSVGMLRFLGVSIEAALAATLLLRLLTFWLPMLPGIWLARREIGKSRLTN